MLHRRNNDAAVPCERQEERLGNWQATNPHRIVNGQPFGIGQKKGSYCWPVPGANDSSTIEFVESVLDLDMLARM